MNGYIMVMNGWDEYTWEYVGKVSFIFNDTFKWVYLYMLV